MVHHHFIPLVTACVLMLCSFVRASDQGARVARLEGSGGVAISFSRDGRAVLTAGGVTAQLWNTTTYEPIGPALKHDHDISVASLSPDGRLAMTAAGPEVILWDMPRGARLRSFKHESKVRDAMLSSDGRILATACEDRVARVWDVATGKLLQEWVQSSPIRSVSLSPDGKRLLVGLVYDREQLKALRPGAGNSAADIDDPMACGDVTVHKLSEDGATWTFRQINENVNLRFALGRPVFSPDGQFVGVPTDQGIFICDAASGEVAARSIRTNNETAVLLFSKDGSRVLMAGHDYASVPDAAVRVLEFDSKPTTPVEARLRQIKSILPATFIATAAMSPDGEWVAAAHKYRSRPTDVTALFDAESGKRAATLEDGAPRNGDLEDSPLPDRVIAFYPNGRLVAVGSIATGEGKNGYTTIWRVPE